MAKFKTRRTASGFQERGAGQEAVTTLGQQNQRVVDQLKLQQARSKEYRDDTEQSLRDVGRNELGNLKEINQLETKIYNNKYNNIEKRRDTEVAYYKGIAKEYGKKKDFWQDFSVTHAAKYGALAGAATDIAEKIVSKAKTKKAKKDNYLEIETTKKAAEEFTTKLRENINKDIDKNSGDQKVTNSLFGLSFAFATTHADNIRADIETNFSRFEQSIKQVYGEKLTKDNVLEIYQEEVEAALSRAEVSPNANGYDEAIDFIRSKAIAQQIKFIDDDDVKKSQDIYDTALENSNNIRNTGTQENYKTRSALFNTLVRANNEATIKNKNGTVSRIADRNGGNIAQAFFEVSVAKLWSKDYESLEDWYNDTVHLLTTDGKTTYARHLKKYGTELRKEWVKKQEFYEAESTATHKANHNAAYLDLKKRLTDQNSVHIDPETKEETPNYLGDKVNDPSDNWAGKTELWKIMLNNPNNIKLQQLVANYIKYNPESRVSTENQKFMIQALDNADVAEFMSVYALLSEADKNDFAPEHKIIQDIKSIRGKGNVSTYVKSNATTAIKAAEKSGLPGAVASHGTESAKRMYEQLVWVEFGNMSDETDKDNYVKNPNHRLQKAHDIVNELLAKGAKDGTGVFRRSDPLGTGGDVKWWTWLPEDGGREGKTEMTLAFIRNRAENSAITYDKFLSALRDKDQSFSDGDGYGYIISKDDVDILWQDLANGYPIKSNKNISYIAEVYGQSPTKVWNDLLNLDVSNSKERVNYVSDNEVDNAKKALATLPGFISPETYKLYNNSDIINIKRVAELFNETGDVPMKDHIRSYFNPESTTPLTLTEPLSTNNITGEVTFTDMEEAIRMKDTWLQDYWYNPHTNTFVPNPPSED